MALALFVALAACFDMSALKDLQALSADINKQYQQPANVNLSNGGRLTVTFQNSPFEELPQLERDSLARDVARFAYSHYVRRDSLSTVGVGFQSVKGAAGFTVSRSSTPYSFDAAELH